MEEKLTPAQEGMKAWIDGASYEQLLAKWRNAPADEPIFRTDIGMFDYYQNRMNELRDADPGEHVRASKSIGWQ